MNRFVADPHWDAFIVWYFYLGGIAAGAYAVATLVGLFGRDEDRRAVRYADYIAFPLVCVCGLLLTIDLGRPERFWHMLIRSNTLWPMFKWWSPMSIGSWALSLFGAFSAVSFVGALAEDRFLGLGRWADRAASWRRSLAGKLFSVAGSGSAFFLGSYTGVLLSATNQPIWAQTTWLAPLFLASAASTGVAVLVLLARWREGSSARQVIGRLERLDGWAIALELLLIVALTVSLGRAADLGFRIWPGMLIPSFVVPFGLTLPLVLKRCGGSRCHWAAAVLVLAGGFALRMAVVGLPPRFLLTAHP
jgi:formate-dependent nitrite reductase membrane component NrfD